jgi:hypothetical protein
LIICLFTGIIIRSNSNAANLVTIIFQIKTMAAKKTIQDTKADDISDCVDRMITSDPPSLLAEKNSNGKPWVISGPVNFYNLNPIDRNSTTELRCRGP